MSDQAASAIPSAGRAVRDTSQSPIGGNQSAVVPYVRASEVSCGVHSITEDITKSIHKTVLSTPERSIVS